MICKKFLSEIIRIFLIVFALPAVSIAGNGSDNSNEDLNALISSFSFPPLLHISETYEFSGTMGETLKFLCTEAGLKCAYEVVPLKRAYSKVRKKDSDAIITINVGQLKDCCIPSDWSVPWTAGLFSDKDVNNVPSSPKDLIGKSLIVVKGMKSPYAFAKNLDEMSDEGKVRLHRATNIVSSVRMLVKQRASLLWGGEDFKWYISKINKNYEYDFKPLITIPVVVWVHKDKPDILLKLNAAFKKLKDSNVLGIDNFLQPKLMAQKYIDAPFNP